MCHHKLEISENLSAMMKPCAVVIFIYQDKIKKYSSSCWSAMHRIPRPYVNNQQGFYPVDNSPSQIDFKSNGHWQFQLQVSDEITLLLSRDNILSFSSIQFPTDQISWLRICLF